MSKFCSNVAINRALDRAHARRDTVNAAITMKVAKVSQEYAEKYGDTSGTYAYMTGMLQSMLADIASSESIAEMRRKFKYNGIEL